MLYKNGVVKVWGKTGCPFCTEAVKLLKSLIDSPVEYVELNMDTSAAEYVLWTNRLIQHVAKTEFSEHRTFPWIFIGKKFIGGFDNLMELITDGSLDFICMENSIQTKDDF